MSEELTEQSIFDTVARHLIKQGRRAQDGASCMYRAPNGDKCAVGCLISDDEYDPIMEGQGAVGIVTQYVRRLAPFESLLVELQGVHDFNDNWHDFNDNWDFDVECGIPSAPDEWRKVIRARLRRAAARFNLNPAVLDEQPEAA